MSCGWPPRKAGHVPYVEVAVNSPAPFVQAFSYAVEAGLSLVPGDAVLAPFGPRILPGIVIEVVERPAYDGALRTITERLGESPLLSPDHVRLARWLADYYLSPIAAAVALMLPRGASDPADFVPPETPTIPALRLEQPPESALRLLASAPAAHAGRALRSVVALIDAGGTLTISLLRSAHGLTPAAERLLLSNGLASSCGMAELAASCETGERPQPVAAPQLTADQQHAVSAITASMRRRFAGHDSAGSFLLHGVTGSGKTEVYLAALDAARRLGRQGIVLVPEIALTPQTVDRFSARFPGRVAVVHGQVPRNRHRRQWFGAREGAFDVVVGARSAIFAPLQRLGLIVVDEEHEPSYKQSDPAPRYHAREVAAELARLTGAVLVLGSATPDVGSFRRAHGRNQLLTLPTRVTGGSDGIAGERPMPEITVVDMARELREGHQGVLSRVLDGALESTLAAGDQALLFLNRRGTASLLLCRDCGYAPRCPRCSVAYALHVVEGKLVCHLCHHSRRIVERCPKCRSSRIRPVGIGTQRLEELVIERFPAARVVRWDGDTAGTPAKHRELARIVAEHEADIVVGTQMVAKGHDFSGITLVGVVSADLSLNLPDFRSAERTFQLLTQVAGRAGRRDRPGRVLIQTYAPENYAVAAAAAYDYRAFARRELDYRRQLSYPPFAPLTRLIHSHSSEAAVERGAKRYAELLRNERERLGLPGPQIIGPAPCYFGKISGRWRWQLLLRGNAARELLAAMPPPVRWTIDIDPIELL